MANIYFSNIYSSIIIHKTKQQEEENQRGVRHRTLKLDIIRMYLYVTQDKLSKWKNNIHMQIHNSLYLLHLPYLTRKWTCKKFLLFKGAPHFDNEVSF